jgi:hypothetical protein
MDYLMTCGGYQLRPALPYIPGTDDAGVVSRSDRCVEQRCTVSLTSLAQICESYKSDT